VTTVLLLTAPACHYCDDARALLTRLVEEFEFELETDSTTAESGRGLALAHGVLFPPALFVNGAFLQYGRPSEGKLRVRLQEVGAQERAQIRP